MNMLHRRGRARIMFFAINGIMLMILVGCTGSSAKEVDPFSDSSINAVLLAECIELEGEAWQECLDTMGTVEANDATRNSKPVEENEIEPPPLENKLILSEAAAEVTECTREFHGLLQDDGSFAQSPEGLYVSGEVWVNCDVQLTVTAVYETNYDPGFIRCTFANLPDNTITYPVIGWGAEGVEIAVDIWDFSKYQDHNGDLEPDIPPDPAEGWYPPFACVLTDNIEQDVYESPDAVHCLAPDSMDPMPENACLMDFIYETELLSAPVTDSK